MVSARARRLLAVVAVILVAAGFFALLYGTSPAGVNETDPIPAGWANFNEFSWAVLAGGTLQGNFTCLNGTPVQVFVYNDAQYGSYVNGANLSGFYNVTAVRGTLSLSVAGFDTYHVVFQHGAGYEDTNQTVAVTLTATGADPTFTIGGIAAIGIGIVLIAYVVVRSRKTAKTTPAGPQWDTFQPSPARPPPSGPSPSAPGTFQIPPPLPGSPAGGPAPVRPVPANPSAPVGEAPTPVGSVLVTLENRSAADATVDLVVNGTPVTSLTIPAGQSRQLSVSARLSSVFGSTVTVEAVSGNARRARNAVFVGAGGTAPMTLRLG